MKKGLIILLVCMFIITPVITTANEIDTIVDEDCICNDSLNKKPDTTLDNRLCLMLHKLKIRSYWLHVPPCYDGETKER